MVGLLNLVYWLLRRRIRYSWGLLALTSFGILAAVTLMATGAFYSRALSEAGLRHSLASQSADILNAQVTAQNRPLDPARLPAVATAGGRSRPVPCRRPATGNRPPGSYPSRYAGNRRACFAEPPPTHRAPVLHDRVPGTHPAGGRTVAADARNCGRRGGGNGSCDRRRCLSEHRLRCWLPSIRMALSR